MTLKTCSICKKEKNREKDFYHFFCKTNKRIRFQAQCRECNKKASRYRYVLYATNPKKKKELLERTRELYQENPERHREASGRSYRKHQAARDAVGRRRWRERRERIVSMYGGICVCCGEAQMEFLALDHIDGGGNQDKRSFSSANKYWNWIVEKLRPGYQILCHNCNSAKGYYGKCPHES